MAKGPNPIDKHVGARVRTRRLTLGMSQQKLAGELGITFQQVQKYEKGVNRISASRLQQISYVLEVSVPYFFEGTPQVSKKEANLASPDYVSKFVVSSDGLALVKAFQRLGKATLRRSIVHMVEEIAEDQH